MASAKKSIHGIPDRSLTFTPTPAERLDLAGRALLVVGGTDGRALARLAAARGAAVTVVGRTFRDEGVAGLRFVRADLSSMKESDRLGRELPVEGLDVVALTHGIMAASTREVTAEGLERDTAVSYLSRLAIVRALAPRLADARGGAGGRAPRVFVMGFPGAGNAGELDDLNAERRHDAMTVHMNTVAGNEMLVLDASARYPDVRFYGLNPGLVRTNIRANLLGEGSLKHRAAELRIGLFTPTPDTYAARLLPVLFAPEIEDRSGAMFGAKGQAILPTTGLTPERVGAFIASSESLVGRALTA